MKKILLPILTLASLLFASCQMEEPGSGKLTGEVDFSVTAEIPNGIMTYTPAGTGSHNGGAVLLDPEEYTLRYTLEVYEKDGTLAYEATENAENGTFNGVTFDVRLLAKTYDFVFWADFVKKKGNVEFYNVADLKNITYQNAITVQDLTTDAADAYYGTKEVNLTESNKTLQVTLRRPFGKIRLLATDNPQNQVADELKVPASAIIAFTDAKVPATFNALTGEASEPTLSISGYTFTAKKETDPVVTGHTGLTSAYLLGQTYFFESPSSTSYKMKVTVNNEGGQIGYRELSGIPVNENKLTTVIGNFYTNEGSLEVIVDDKFGGESEYDAETAITRSFEEINQALADGWTKILYEGVIHGSNENTITVPANAPEEFSIDLGGEYDGFSPSVTIKGTDGDETSRKITVISQAPTAKYGLDIYTKNSTYTLEGRYSGVVNHEATSLVKTMGYIMKLTLYEGNAEIYANIGTGIEFKGSGIIKYAVADNGKELETYGKFAAEGKCEKIAIDADFTYVNGMYIAGEIDLQGHTITMNPKPGKSNPFFVQKDLVMKNGTIVSTCPDATYSLFQIEGGVSVSLQNVNVETNANIMSSLKEGTSISLADCKMTAGYYVISTNASVSDPTNITVERCTLSGSSAILKNVPGLLTVKESTITGNIHGIIVRGGDAEISNSTVVLNYNEADYASDLEAYRNGNWGQGNQMPLAAMTIGNRHPSSYQYPTNVTLKNTQLKLEGSTALNFPTLYAYANQTAGLGVTLTYDEDCRFDKNPELASANITVNGSSRWTGASADPVIDETAKTVAVNSADQLAGLAKMVNEDSKPFSGYKITLNADIDLADQPWTPIGNGNRGDADASHFSGVFDGNGHTIRNINAKDDRGDNYGAGLFSIVKDATVKNLNVEGGSVEAVDFAAAVVGIAFGNTTIENCHVKGVSVKTDDVAAGIVARAYGTSVTVKDCTNASDIYAAKKAGGIAGIASNNCKTVIENCTNSGSVKAPSDGVGGILGYAGPAENRIVNCRNTASVGASDNKYSGGIVGYQQSSDPVEGLVIESCKNEGTVTGINAGGIYGMPGSSQPVTITGSVNNGAVNGTTSAGGIAARASAGKIENCTNTADVTASSSGKGVAGGIVGNLGEARIISCKGGDASAVISAQYAGRLVGHVSNKPYKPEDVLAELQIDDSNGDYYEGYLTIGTMGLNTSWANINITSGTLHGKPLIDGSAPGYIKIHEGASWDAFPSEKGTWKCAPTDNNNWTKLE